MDEAAGIAELSSPLAWLLGADRGDGRLVSAMDVVVGQREGVTAVEMASTTSSRNTSRLRSPPATRLWPLR